MCRGSLLYCYSFSDIHVALIFSYFLLAFIAKLIRLKNSTAPGQTLDSFFSFFILPQIWRILINLRYINFLFFTFPFPEFCCLSGGLGYLIVPKLKAGFKAETGFSQR